MFMGEYHHNMDDKGRLTIPSKIRYELGEEFIVTRGFDGCLFVYKTEDWENLIKKYKNLPNVKDVRNFMRFFLASASKTCFDKQGRINLSTSLIKYAELKKECVIIGVLDRLEIWDLDKWNCFSLENEKNLALVVDNLFSNEFDA